MTKNVYWYVTPCNLICTDVSEKPASRITGIY